MDCDKLDCDYRDEDRPENCGIGTGSQFCPMFETNSLTNKKEPVAKLHCSDGLDNREVFAKGLIELWPHLKRATQLDVINRLREQPKAMLKPMQLQILEANLKTEQG